jgi:hypothetical protein
MRASDAREVLEKAREEAARRVEARKLEANILGDWHEADVVYVWVVG